MEKDSKLESFSYYQSLERKGDEFIYKTFNPDKRILTHYKTYSDAKMKNLNGRYQEWYDNGHLWEEGKYKNNEKEGKWSTYGYDSGKVKEYGHFKNGKEEGTWFSLDDQGRITSEYNYLSGELEGDYLRYDSLGNVVQKIIYQAGDEIENEIFDSTYTNSELKDVEVLPFLKTCADLAGDERKQCSDNKYLHFEINTSPKKSLAGKIPKPASLFLPLLPVPALQKSLSIPAANGSGKSSLNGRN